MADDRRAAGEAAARRRLDAALRLQDELLPLPQTERVQTLRKRRKAGRPPGARNRRSEDVARFVIERIGDPLLVQAMVACMPAEELAAAAGWSVGEAIAEKRLAAGLVLPYLHRRQPLAVDLTDHRVVYLTVSAGAPARVAEDGAQVLEVVEYQQVAEGEGDAV